MFRKIKISFLMAIMVFSLSACTATEETIDINAWKDKLIQPSEQQVTIGEDIKDAADKVVEGAQEMAGEVSNAVSEGIGTAKDNIQDAAENVNSLLGEQGDAQKDSFLTRLGNTISNMLRGWGKEGADKVDTGSSFDNNYSDGYYTEETSPSDTTIKEDAEASEKKRISVKFCRVVDGDTIIIEYQNQKIRVRLIGINTPESVAPDEYLQETGKENTQEGVDASNFLKGFMDGKTNVWLEFDADLEDDYGRALAYVWLSGDGEDIPTDMLNAIMLKEKYAEVMTIKPNTRYVEEFEKLTKDSGEGSITEE